MRCAALDRSAKSTPFRSGPRRPESSPTTRHDRAEAKGGEDLHPTGAERRKRTSPMTDAPSHIDKVADRESENENAEREIAELVDPINVSGRIRVALELMVFDGLTARQAAEGSGLAVKSLHAMLCQPKYAQAYRRLLEVRRTSEQARSFQRLLELRDQERHMPVALAATRQILGLGDRGGGQGAAAGGVTVNVVSPGWIIRAPSSRVAPGGEDDRLLGPADGAGPVIDIEPDDGSTA